MSQNNTSKNLHINLLLTFMVTMNPGGFPLKLMCCVAFKNWLTEDDETVAVYKKLNLDVLRSTPRYFDNFVFRFLQQSTS